MRLKGSAAVLEARRHRALRLLDQGRSLNEVARLLDCAPSSVMRWLINDNYFCRPDDDN
jgi:hypothetical protein